jgi:hypothetical protein
MRRRARHNKHDTHTAAATIARNQKARGQRKKKNKGGRDALVRRAWFLQTQLCSRGQNASVLRLNATHLLDRTASWHPKTMRGG